MMIPNLQKEAIALLREMIATESFSGKEKNVVAILKLWLHKHAIKYQQHLNNIWAVNEHFDPSKKTILLNSHHDTVEPNKAYTRNPFDPTIENGKLYGLGSNDAGGCLVALMATFVYYYRHKNLKYNLLLLASAEEESSGDNGIACMLSKMPVIDFAIIGEPTGLNLAIAEKGLLVLDCYTHGTPGHAAHRTDDFAIYKAMEAIRWFSTYEFDKVSKMLGKVKMTVTQINAGVQHNVVPAKTHFVVDIRINDKYTNAEILSIVQKNVACEVVPRSLILNSSAIDKAHPIVQSGISLGKKTYGSPTLSDQSRLSCPSLKLGTGDSMRSHSADEFIYIKEIEEGIAFYIEILGGIL